MLFLLSFLQYYFKIRRIGVGVLWEKRRRMKTEKSFPRFGDRVILENKCYDITPCSREIVLAMQNYQVFRFHQCCRLSKADFALLKCVYTTPRKMSFLCNLFLCFSIQILLTNSSDSLPIFSFFAFKLEVFRACTKRCDRMRKMQNPTCLLFEPFIDISQKCCRKRAERFSILEKV